MDYLNTVNDLYPVRRTKKEKENFRNYVLEEVTKYHKTAEVEKLKNNYNVVIGDIEKAKVVFTAHYDTPATSIIPNLMMPRNLVLGYLYHFSYPLVLAIISIFISKLICEWLNLIPELWVLLYLVLYLGLFLLCMMTFKNKQNKNDNTSGVSTILSIVSKGNTDNVAFVLFDNEEKGLLGSKTFSKAHKEIFKNKLVINLDCVGVGNNVLLISKDEATKTKEHQILQETVVSNKEYNVLYYPMKGSMGNSDHKNFNCGVGVMTCYKGPNIGYYASRIHTNKDTIAETRNIEFISQGLSEFINKLND